MAAYPKPTNNTGTFNNQSFVNPDTGGLTIDEAKQYFVTFPNTQSPSTIIANNFNTTGSLNVAGDSQFGGDVEFIGGVSIAGEIVFENDVEVTGTTTLDDNLLCLTTATVTELLTCEGGIDITTLGDGITFPDNTTQTTAFIEANYAQLNTDNTFLTGFTQTFDGVVDLGDSASASGLTLNNNTLSYLLQPRLSGTDFGLTVINALSNNSTLSLSNGGGNVISMTCTGPQTLNIAGSVTATSFNISNSSYFTSGNNTGINNNTTGTLNPFIYFAINDLSNVQQIPLYIYWNSLLLSATLNMNSYNITNIGALTGNAGIVTVNSAISMGSGNAININNSTLNLYSGTIVTNIGQGVGQVYFNNNAPFANSPSFSFALYKSGGFTSVLDLSPTVVALTTQLNMNNNNIINIDTITGNSTSNITVNSTIGMGTGKSINMNNNSILLVSSISGGSGTTPITINSPLSMSPSCNIAMNNNNITLMGSGSTAFTQPGGTSNTSIATTAYVQNMYVTQTISLAANNLYYEVVPGFNSFISSYIQLDNNQYIVTLNTLLTTSNPMQFDTNTAMPPNTVNTLTFTFNGGVTVPYAPSTGTNLGKIVLQNNDTLTQQNVRVTMFNNAVILTLQNTVYLSPNTSYELYFIKNNITVG
jgi:hypothetical protein